MNYREAWANGEIEAGTLVDRIDEQALTIERLEAGIPRLQEQLYQARQELAALKAQPSGVVLPPHCTDRAMPVKYRKGWNCCISEVARLNQPASAGDDGKYIPACLADAIMHGQEVDAVGLAVKSLASAGDIPPPVMFSADAIQRLYGEFKELPTYDERAAFDCWLCSVKGYKAGTDTSMLNSAFMPWRAWQARAALSANHSEQMRMVLPEPVRDALARRCLWLAFCWNDHNFGPAHEEARKEALKHGIDSFESANEWLAAAPSAGSQGGDV